jgi:hypothetical protein
MPLRMNLAEIAESAEKKGNNGIVEQWNNG